jgi:hypothetical protein
MLKHPHAGGKRVTHGYAKQDNTANFGLTPPSPTYDGVTYVIETERLTKTPDNGTPERGAA